MHPQELDTREYQKIFARLKSDKQGLLISGGAGTGKTTFIEYISSEEGIKQFPLAEKMVITAPTGVAAMRAGGATIHSLFEFPPETFDYENRIFAGGERITTMESKQKLFTEINLLVIDEVSMVRADLMDAINLSLQVHRGNALPFGGVKVLFIGDIFQLQPVVTTEDRSFLSERYPDKSGMFFFESLVFAEMLDRDRMAFFELKIPYRFDTMEGDRKRAGRFPAMLERLRRGDARDLSTINKSLARSKHCQQLLHQGAVMLTGRRRDAESYNKHKLQSLSSKLKEFIGEAEGKCAEYKDERLPAPRQLSLKKGAQVIFVRNDGYGKWRNGTLGYVDAFGYDEEKATEYIRVRTDAPKPVYVEREVWEIYSYHYDAEQRKVVKQEDGSYTQFPLMLAWALTIHRAQGQTLDRVVVNMDGGAFSAGQAYVALSRCRLAKHLGLMQPLTSHDLICHTAANAFYAKIFPPNA